MGHWSSKPPLVWTDERLVLFAHERFRVVDGGAAGTLFEPFASVAETCEVYTFEVRGSAEIEGSGHTNIDAGIWSHRATETLHVARGAKASSIYPPDLGLLARFPDRVGVRTRETVNRVAVELTSIDEEVRSGSMLPPNFIKLDVHSSEYEAIIGSRNSLRSCLGFLVETWHAPVHAGQHLNGEIEALLSSLGFQLHDTVVASAWLHSRSGRTEATDRRQVIGSESLFLRDTLVPELAAWQIALFELFGYSTRALQLCDEAMDSAVRGADKVPSIRDALLENQGVRAKAQRQMELQAAHKAKRTTNRMHDDAIADETTQTAIGPAELDQLNGSTLEYIRSLSSGEIARRLDEVAIDRLHDEKALARARGILAAEGIVVILNFLGEDALQAAALAVSSLKTELAKATEASNRETETLLVQSAERVVTGYAGLCRHPKAVANIRRGSDAGMVDVFNFDRLLLDQSAVLRRPFEDPLLLGLMSDGDVKLRAANLNLYLNRDITHTRGFHSDSYDRSLKGLCYVSDAADLTFGPYCYVRRTHLDGPWRWANRKISELCKAPTEAPFVDPAMIVPCVGPKGALILSDQSGIHRGLPQDPGRERQVLVMRYR